MIKLIRVSLAKGLLRACVYLCKLADSLAERPC